MFVFIQLQIALLSVIQLNCALNISNMLDIYNAVCGNMLCDKNLIKYAFNVENESSCPKCTCDISCIRDRQCCPDIFLKLQPKCIESTFLSENPYIKNDSYIRVLMIDTCPVGSNETIKNLCESLDYRNDGMITNPPVMSEKSGLTYRNVYCSQCFNESAENVRSLSLELVCRFREGFHLLSSYNELFDLAKENQCYIYYTDKSLSCSQKLGVISTCNISGTWLDYDSDVEYACQTYDNTFQSYKNVFCYICNPPYPKEQVIQHCNVSGFWTPYDSDLEKACSDTRRMTVMGSYKNIYCYLCNRNNINLTDGSIFSDNTVKLTYSSSINGAGQYVFSYDFIDVDIPQLIKRSQEIELSTTNDSNSLTDTSMINSTIKAGNKTQMDDVFSLLKYYYAFTGRRDFCHTYSFFHDLDSCSCSDDCYFDNFGCCLDKLLENAEKAMTCTDQAYSNFNFPVFSICDTRQDQVLNRLCHSNNHNDIFTFLPVEAPTSTGDIIQYKNIFCFLCNRPADNQESHGYIYNPTFFFWTLNAICDVYMPIKYHIIFEDYINVARQNKCKFKYSPYSYERVGQCDEKKHDRCNITGKWKTFDNDISLACEYTANQKSAFCSMCNPENFTEIIYSACNETGLWKEYDTEINDNCQNLPRIDSNAPYKNYFCRQCNPQLNNGSAEISFFRLLFDFSNYRETHIIPSKNCKEGQLFIGYTNDCRNVKCYPGRIHTDKGCIPLLGYAKDLVYILSIGLKGTLVETIYDTLAFVQSIQAAFETFLQDFLQNVYLLFQSAYLLANLSCSAGSKWEKGSHVWISLYQEIFISNYFNRLEIEEKLVSLPNTKFNLPYEDTVQPFVFIKDQNAYFLKTLHGTLNFSEKCFQDNTNKWLLMFQEQIDLTSLVILHVNELLMCEQIELNESEFSVNINNFKLSLAFVTKELNYDEYILISSNKARVCLNTIMNLNKNNDDQNTLNAVEIIQIGCTCISLVCLLCTFVTYCLFPSLRTMPGRNNMCLIFAMFWAQFIFQFIIIGKRSEIGCKMLGVLIHYFWLATSGCLSVCSYHMYIVFKSKTGAQFSIIRRTITYIGYSFGLPALIITANCVVSASVSENSSIGYGGHFCFLNEMIAFIATFILPITLICCFNLVFFILTAVTIARTPKVKTEEQNRVNQIQFTVYVKLFTITGISWLFQIIDSFLPMSSFSIIVSIMNTLQGVFIFASYILNKRVFNLYKNARKSINEYPIPTKRTI